MAQPPLPPHPTPAQAWQSLREGNERFVGGAPVRPNQGVDDRHRLTAGQHPHTALFGCSDSRVAAEIVFDQGLGDMFVVRSAGHVIDSAILGSLEFAVESIGVSLIVVLGHDSCGALGATLQALDHSKVPDGFIRDVVERVTPSVLMGRGEGLTTLDELEDRHVVETTKVVMQRSRIIADAVTSGRVAIIGATYRLDDGRAVPQVVHGVVGDTSVPRS